MKKKGKKRKCMIANLKIKTIKTIIKLSKQGYHKFFLIHQLIFHLILDLACFR